jgi:hypothetical protein
VEAIVMTEGVDLSDLPLETQWELYELCQRRESIGEEAFAEGLCAALEIPRAMLDKAIVMAAAGGGLCEAVREDRMDFDDAFAIASARLAKMRN